MSKMQIECEVPSSLGLYKVFMVDEKTWEAAIIDDAFESGIVVDGVYDQKREQHLLIVRYDNADQ